MARAATTSGMPAAMSEAKTRIRMSAANGNETVSAWTSSRLGLGRLVLRRGRDARQLEGQIGRRVDERPEVGHAVDGFLVA